jgi:urate oxidase
VTLKGNFEASYTKGDNSAIVPTDTIKNSVQVLAFKYLGEETEKFGVILAEHFVKTYSQADYAYVSIRERPWERMTVGGHAHPHSFCESGAATPVAKVTSGAGRTIVTSGIENFLILKTTESGFEGFAKDEFTTLAETKDRVFATTLNGSWVFDDKPTSYLDCNRKIVHAMTDVFAGAYSPSVQATLYQMGRAALSAVPEIEQITLKLPNKHYLLANLAPFGLENRNELFIPTDEPYGRIEGTVTR